MAALAMLDETRIAEALMAGSIDVEGEMLEVLRLRPLLGDRHPVQAYWFKKLRPLMFGQARSDGKWIAQHYDEDADFYELFLDSRRCYSHGIFEAEDESLDENWFRNIVLTQVEPLLREYWFDQPAVVKEMLSGLVS